MKRSHWVAAAIIAAAVVQPLSAQDVQFRRQSEFKTSGALGTLMSMASRAQGGDAQIRTEYVSGRRMRTDEGKASSTIIDLEQNRMYMLQHEEKTYFSMSLDSMVAGMAAMGDAMAGAEIQPQASVEEAPSLEFKVEVDRTGERSEISGYRAERVLVTLEAERMESAPDPSADEDGPPTRLVLLMDLWLSGEVPGYGTLQAFQQELATNMQAAAPGAAGAADMMLDMITQTPGTQQALEKAAEEMRKLPGMPVRTSTFIVTVPVAERFQRDPVLNPESPSAGSAARSAARSAIGGLFGRKKQAADEETGEPTQSTVLTLIDTLMEVDTGPLSPDLFRVPADYTEIEAAADPEGV